MYKEPSRDESLHLEELVSALGVPQGERVLTLLERYLSRSIPWPNAVTKPASVDDLIDRYQGCLLWGAVGDALGRAVEGLDPGAIRASFGPAGLRQFVPWHGWTAGPTGTITDDTQLTIEVARTMLASAERFDCVDFAHRLVDWLPFGRGKGQATTSAVSALRRGLPWWRAGLEVNSGGNGAAMRARLHNTIPSGKRFQVNWRKAVAASFAVECLPL